MIKKRSTTYYILSMLVSANHAPKSKVALIDLSNREGYRVQRALDVLVKYGYAVNSGDKYCVTSLGKKVLLDMAS